MKTSQRTPLDEPQAAKARFALVLQAPDSGDAAIRRLRAFLKMALRAYGLRCVRCEPVQEETP